MCRFLWQRVKSLNHVVQSVKQKATILVRLGTVFNSIFGWQLYLNLNMREAISPTSRDGGGTAMSPERPRLTPLPARGHHMYTATTITETFLKFSGSILIILGLLFWTGHALTLIPFHMLLGFLLVLSLWTLAGLAATSGVNWGWVLLAIIWGFIVVTFGLTQTQLLPGSTHWVIQVLHLLIGLAAIGLGEGLAVRIKGRRTPAVQAWAALIVAYLYLSAQQSYMSDSRHRPLIDRYIAAYNAFDIDGMLALLSSDVRFETTPKIN
jgi:hypothetical protein